MTAIAIKHAEILRRQRIAVTSEADVVVVQLGNVEFRMHYEDALLFSQWTRMRAKEAKRRAGDISRHWSAIGVLHDAQYGPDKTRG